MIYEDEHNAEVYFTADPSKPDGAWYEWVDERHVSPIQA